VVNCTGLLPYTGIQCLVHIVQSIDWTHCQQLPSGYLSIIQLFLTFAVNHNECLVKASVVAMLNEVFEVVSLASAESHCVLSFLAIL
jgi:hypothetical protein